MTKQLPKVEVYTTSLMSGATDSSDIRGQTDFTSNTQDRITTTTVPLIEPAHVVSLPKGQAFALLEGGNLWKVRMPLPAPDPDEVMPKDLQQLAGYMRQHYVEAGDWWENRGLPGLQDEPCRTTFSTASGTLPQLKTRRHCHERSGRDSATPAEPPAGADRRHHHAAVSPLRCIVRLAPSVHRHRVRWHAPVLAGTGMAARTGNAGLRAGPALRPLHPQSALVQEPGRTAHWLVEQAYEWIFVKTGLLEWMRTAANQASAPAMAQHGIFATTSAGAYVWVESYLIAAAFTTLVFIVRLMVLVLTLPLFLMAAFVGLVDGLVRRDIRRFGAGRESGFIYHRAKASLMPLAVLPWVIYLALPVSISPLLILLPSAVLLGLATDIAAGSFKKYL